MSELTRKFESHTGNNSFSRIDDTHLLDIYVGFDNNSNYCLMIILDLEPQRLLSTKVIDVTIFTRKDNRYAVNFSLLQSQYLDLFFQICEDLIEQSRKQVSQSVAQSFLIERFRKWQNLMRRSTKGLLTNQEIKGLIGELVFLRDILLKKLPHDKALAAWTGPEKLKQDYILESTWFEIKAVSEHAESVKISSIEQLDIDRVGYLVVAKFAKTSDLDKEKITLNIIYNELVLVFEAKQLRTEFDNILFDFGYIDRAEYDFDMFRFIEFNFYEVNSRFPSLRRKELPNALMQAIYDISLPSLIDFKVENISFDMGDLWN